MGKKYLLQVVVLCLLVLGCVQMATGGTRDVVYATILGRLNQAVIGMMMGFSFDRLRKYASNPLVLLAALGSISFALLWLHAKGGVPGTGNNVIWVFWLSFEALLWGAVICSYQACRIKIPDAISKAVAYLGSISYSLYVVHYFVACTLCTSFANLLLAEHHRYKFLFAATRVSCETSARDFTFGGHIPDITSHAALVLFHFQCHRTTIHGHQTKVRLYT